MEKGINHVKVDQLEWQKLPGGFKYKWIAKGDKFLTGLGVAEPGGGETWHKHTREVEETYYILKGQGRISWKADGKVYHQDFSEGDAFYLTFGSENEFVNTGKEELLLTFSITNAPKMRE